MDVLSGVLGNDDDDTDNDYNDNDHDDDDDGIGLHSLFSCVLLTSGQCI